jgi:hypothetical protein
MKKCSKCKKTKSKTEFHKNKSRYDGLNHACKECRKAIDREYNERNRSKVRERRRKYRIERKKTDPVYKLKCNLRRRMSGAFKVSYWTKSSTTKELLGEEYEVVHKHLEDQFTEGMSWDNYGEWHIDHIIPLASAKTEEELIALFHYTNLQPLWAADNIAKADKIL